MTSTSGVHQNLARMSSPNHRGMSGFRLVIEDASTFSTGPGHTSAAPDSTVRGRTRRSEVPGGGTDAQAIQKKTAVIRLSSMVVPQ